jgi:WD40 repeat protein
MLTGSSGDYTVKIWDFTTMNKLLKPSKEFKPFDGHPIRSLSFCGDSRASMFLCCTTNA